MTFPSAWETKGAMASGEPLANAVPEAGRRVTLISGASTGIGAAMAEVFASKGHSLVLVALEADLLEALAARLRAAHGVTVQVLALDVTEPGAVDRILTLVTDQALTIDVLVNNAGIGLAGSFASNSLVAIRKVMSLNMMASVELMHRVLPEMIARGHGRVLNTSSTAAFQPGPGMAVYFATKAFITSLSRAVAFELQGTGVTVTALHPGPTRSAFSERAGLTHGKSLGQVSSFADPIDVARDAYAGLMRGASMVIPGWQNRLFARLSALTPTRLVMRAVHRLHQQAS